MNEDTKMILQAITELRTEFKSDIAEEIAQLRTEVKSDIAELRSEIKAEIVELRSELKTEINNLREEVKAEFAIVHQRLDDLSERQDSQLYRVAKLEEEVLILRKKA